MVAGRRLCGYFPSMPFKHNAARRHRISRARYCVTNWPAYETGLQRRSDLTLWLNEAALAGREAPKRSSPGGQPLYSELAIEFVLTLRLVFHLALRQAEAFRRSTLRLLGLVLSVPDHSTLSRRGRAFAGRQPRVLAKDGPVHLMLDSMSLELFGQGEWDAEKHGRLRRQWRKLHLAVNADTGVIASVTADGAYDGEPTTRRLWPGSAIHRRTLSSRAGHRRCQARTRAAAAFRGSVTATSGSWPSAAAWVGKRRPGMAGGTRPKRPWRDRNT